MIKELNEQEILAKIEAKEAFILDVYMEDCSYCVEYAPIFEKASDKSEWYKFLLPAKSAGGSVFKRKYMTANGKEKIAAPATFIFENGVMVARKYGIMSEQELLKMVETKQAPESQNGEKIKQELFQLFARKGEIITINEDFTNEMQLINNRLNELKKVMQQPQG